MEPKRLGFMSGNDEKKDYERMKGGVMEEVRRIFKPEFLNRIDEIVYYKPLTKEQISKIVLLMLDSLNKRLADRQLKVELTDAAMNAVIDQGFDPVYGARPLKRFIQSKIETLVAKHIIAADVKPGDTLTIDVNENGELYMRW